MRVTIDDKRFAVEFEHSRNTIRTFESRRFREVGKSTVCRIRDLDSPSPADGSFAVIAQAEARCHPRDGFSKEKGRRLALARALDELCSAASWKLSAPAGSPERRVVRRAFWEAYWATKPRTVGPVDAVAAVRDFLRRTVEAEEAQEAQTHADWCRLVSMLDPILALAAKGQVTTDFCAAIQAASRG
jgi:hypothetical protein